MILLWILLRNEYRSKFALYLTYIFVLNWTWLQILLLFFWRSITFYKHQFLSNSLVGHKIILRLSKLYVRIEIWDWDFYERRLPWNIIGTILILLYILNSFLWHFLMFLHLLIYNKLFLILRDLLDLIWFKISDESWVVLWGCSTWRPYNLVVFSPVDKWINATSRLILWSRILGLAWRIYSVWVWKWWR